MADDIDIEEHDVLESLRRRQAPPDPPDDPGQAVLVKSEPLDVEYESNYEDVSTYESQWEWDSQATQIKIEPHGEDFPFGKIILGSKPSTPPRDTGPEDRQDTYNYNMSLIVDDWGPILRKSNCYCEECQILFATVNALDAHKMLAHSFLVALDKEASPERNKAVKSTAKPATADEDTTCRICNYHFKGTGTIGRRNLHRHYRNIHKVDPETIGNIDFKSWRVCNHCNLYFPDDTSLVKHLYELLPLNNTTPTKDDKKSVVPSAVKGKAVDKDVKSETKQANRIILGSKAASVKSDEVDDVSEKWKCNICSIQYSQKYYHTHMRKFHPNIRTQEPEVKSQNQLKTPEKILLNDSSVRYKCLICHQILVSSYSAKKHREKHPQMHRRRIFLKLVKVNKAKSNVIMPAKVHERKQPKPTTEEDQGILVSKSTLFKCNRCSVHFLTCTAACQHSIVCETSSNIRDWACPQCQRVFKSADKTAHEFQHKVMSSKFKVYVVYLEMIVRILCECPYCYVCFEEDKFSSHIQGGCQHDAKSYHCEECRLPIDVCSRANHDSKHKQGDFTKDDFIKIDYVTSKKLVVKTEPDVPDIKIEATAAERRGLKRKLETPEGQKTMSGNGAFPFRLFYCPHCNQYLGSKVEFHLTGQCRDRHRKKLDRRGFCRICGIFFSTKYLTSHKKMHLTNPKLSLADFTFIRMTDLKKIKPQSETYPCKKCNIHFLNKWDRHTHKCETAAGVKCLVCHKRIHRELFKTHMQVHNYVFPGQSRPTAPKLAKNNSILSRLLQAEPKQPTIEKVSRNEAKSPMKLPDLLMKYQSLTALWNILYLCATCDTFTDSYDKVVEHCQNHLTNMENYGVVIKKCPKCDMKFDSECYKRHLELHAGNVINKKTFQILKYEYFNLFSRDWFDFINLPEEQKSQIVSRSMYGENRCVKMRLVQQGPPEYTLYQCNKCLMCVSVDSVVRHVKLANCLKANKSSCCACDMVFNSRALCDQHEQIHEETGLGAESFRIVAFNDKTDVEANAQIMSYDTDDHSSENKIEKTINKTEAPPKTTKSPPKATGKNFVLYKCADCQVCLTCLYKLKTRHRCNKRMKMECTKCGLLFSRGQSFEFHRTLHQKHSFSKKNVIVKTVNKQGNVVNIVKQSHGTNSVAKAKQTVKTNQTANSNDAEKSKLFRCHCGLHFTSLKTIEKHYKMKNCSTVVREKCSQCDLTFDPIEVVNHLCKHHAQNQVKNFDIVTPNRKTLFKCDSCSVLFYSKNDAIIHRSKCTGDVHGKTCDLCGLAFHPACLPIHQTDHEQNDDLKIDCYIIVKVPHVQIRETDKISNMLYKCNICNVHFLRRSSAMNHMNLNKHVLGELMKCQTCGLMFLSKTFNKHVLWQHAKWNMKKFDVTEFFLEQGRIKIKKGKTARPVQHEVPKLKVKEEPKPIQRMVTVYKCTKCTVHFTDEHSLVNHREDRCSKELSEECEDCLIKFSTKNMKEHKKLHGYGVTLTMNIIAGCKIGRGEKIETEYPITYEAKVYKCVDCSLHFNLLKSLHRHRPFCNPEHQGVCCEICNVPFTAKSLSFHKSIHKRHNLKKDAFEVIVPELDALDDSNVVVKTEPDEKNAFDEDTMVSMDSSIELEVPEKVAVVVPKKDTHILYKCADCNVCFVTLKACHKHITKHTPFDSKDYIECKLCGFQFTIMTLQTHIKKHHSKEFNLDEVSVEEYQPNDIKNFETYLANEKNQCLVSTSDDVKKATKLVEDNDSEVTSCNQIVESVFFKSDNSQINPNDETKVGVQETNFNVDESTESHSVITVDDNAAEVIA